MRQRERARGARENHSGDLTDEIHRKPGRRGWSITTVIGDARIPSLRSMLRLQITFDREDARDGRTDIMPGQI